MQSRLLKLLAVLAALAGLALWGRNLRNDLKIDARKITSQAKLSWELGEVESTRVIGKDEWVIGAKNVIRDTPIDRLSDVSAFITGPSGERTVNAPSGTYDNKKNELTLTDASGDWQRPQYPMKWETPFAHWKQKEDMWDFPKGVTVSGDVYSLECAQAQMTGQKNIHVIDGCLRWWSK